MTQHTIDPATSDAIADQLVTRLAANCLTPGCQVLTLKTQGYCAQCRDNLPAVQPLAHTRATAHNPNYVKN